MKPLTVQALEVAVDNFVWRGESIAREFPEAAPDIMAAVADIRRSGAVLAVDARDFTADPCSAARRGVLVSAARALLAAVARLLILADMIDVHVLLQSVARARSDLEFVGRSASSEPELIEGMRRFNASSGRLVQLAGRRQADLKDREAAAGLAAARAVLKGQLREMVFSLIASYCTWDRKKGSSIFFMLC
jgi:catenin alpha